LIEISYREGIARRVAKRDISISHFFRPKIENGVISCETFFDDPGFSEFSNNVTRAIFAPKLER